MKKQQSKVLVVDSEGSSRPPATTKSLTMAARAIARMEAAAQAVHAQANGGGDRGFQAVSSKDHFSAPPRKPPGRHMPKGTGEYSRTFDKCRPLPWPRLAQIELLALRLG